MNIRSLRRTKNNACTHTLLTMLLISACGSEGVVPSAVPVTAQSEETEIEFTQTDPSPPKATGVNGNLAGTLITNLYSAGQSRQYPAGTVVGLDLASGRYLEMSGNDSIAANGLHRDTRVFLFLQPDRSKTGNMVGTVGNCRPDHQDVTCLLFMTADAEVESVAILDGSRYGNAVRSRDGRFVAISRNSSQLEIYSTDGQLISRTSYSSEQSAGLAYDWLNDGRLIVAENRIGEPTRLSRTAPYSTDRDSTLKLKTKFEGAIRSLRVNPDGTRVAMSIESLEDKNGADEYRRLVVFGLDDLSFYEPIAVDYGDSMDAHRPIWSPDGQWLVFFRSNGHRIITAALGPHNNVPDSLLYAIRADGRQYSLPLTPELSNDNVRMILAHSINYDNLPPGYENHLFAHVWAE